MAHEEGWHPVIHTIGKPRDFLGKPPGSESPHGEPGPCQLLYPAAPIQPILGVGLGDRRGFSISQHSIMNPLRQVFIKLVRGHGQRWVAPRRLRQVSSLSETRGGAPLRPKGGRVKAKGLVVW